MRKLPLLLLFIFAAFGASAQVSAEKIVNDFLVPAAGGVFRGFDFETLEYDIMDLEDSRPNVEYNYEDYDEDLNMSLGYDLYFDADEDNFVYLDYKIDLIGIYEVIAEIYTESDKLAYDVFNQLNKYYSSKLGLGTLESDGWTSFDGNYLGDPYTVWIYVDEDEYGKYVRFELIYMGE